MGEQKGHAVPLEKHRDGLQAGLMEAGFLRLTKDIRSVNVYGRNTFNGRRYIDGCVDLRAGDFVSDIQRQDDGAFLYVEGLGEVFVESFDDFDLVTEQQWRSLERLAI